MLMSDAVITAIFAFLGTCIVTLGGIKLITYRLEQLEKKVDKHNNLVERMIKVEQRQDFQEEKIKTIEEDLYKE